MIKRLKSKVQAFTRAFKQSPINYATLGFKDADLNKQYQINNEYSTIQRAYGYMAFLALMLAIVTPMLLSDKHNKIGQYSMVLIGPTFVTVGISALVARIRQSFIQVILPLNVLVRGLMVVFVSPLICDEKMTCISRPLALVSDFMNFSLYLCETNMFPLRLPSYLSLPLYSLFAVIHQKADFVSLPKCSTHLSKLEVMSALAVAILFFIPIYASHYMRAVSELRNYLLAEDN
jgi:hypothetical protein